ncbi:MAG TPA: hypothetical protein VHH73_18660 [Verrucomicrobiae bacterium]|nr:hypothetical protein [Verrucomicrobiae bacterium]
MFINNEVIPRAEALGLSPAQYIRTVVRVVCKFTGRDALPNERWAQTRFRARPKASGDPDAPKRGPGRPPKPRPEGVPAGPPKKLGRPSKPRPEGAPAGPPKKVGRPPKGPKPEDLMPQTVLITDERLRRLPELGFRPEHLDAQGIPHGWTVEAPDSLLPYKGDWPDPGHGDSRAGEAGCEFDEDGAE